MHLHYDTAQAMSLIEFIDQLRDAVVDQYADDIQQIDAIRARGTIQSDSAASGLTPPLAELPLKPAANTRGFVPALTPALPHLRISNHLCTIPTENFS